MADETASFDATSKRSEWRAWYTVFVLALSLMVTFLDLGIVALLVEPIKADLGLSDTQISLIMGFAFTLFYLFMGIPIATLVDRSSRRLILGVGIAVFSVMTAVCGLARTFWQLFLARVGVGVGEACGGPAAYSMLADLFPPHRLPRAIAFMTFGSLAGQGVAFLLGGTVIYLLAQTPEVTLPVLGTFQSWQLTFFIVGLPGLIVASLFFTVPEPARRGRLVMTGVGADARPKAPPLSAVAGFMGSEWRLFLPFLLAVGFQNIIAFGASAWMPTFYIRTYGWTASQAGFAEGILWLVVAPLGVLFGARLAEHFMAKGRNDANVRVAVFSSIIVAVSSFLIPFAPNGMIAVALGGLRIFAAAWNLGPQNAVIPSITPNQMRGRMTAIYLLILNVVGIGLGPTVVALITDFVYGDASMLRYSLATVAAVMGPVMALMFLLSLKPYGRALERARVRDAEDAASPAAPAAP